jgi:hypothetical protein
MSSHTRARNPLHHEQSTQGSGHRSTHIVWHTSPPAIIHDGSYARQEGLVADTLTAEQRAEKPFHPFLDGKEWEFLSTLETLNIPAPGIDAILQTEVVRLIAGVATNVLLNVRLDKRSWFQYQECQAP